MPSCRWVSKMLLGSLPWVLQLRTDGAKERPIYGGAGEDKGDTGKVLRV